MANRPQVTRTVAALRHALESYRRAGQSIALVPTMGALHEGHLTLVREAHKRARRVIVSIFVNPTQFAPHEDFGSYPRRLAADLEVLEEAKADVVWAPSADVMYPEGFATEIQPVAGPAQAGLEDAFRPHFFGGVATVVTKLFLQVAPDVALFGQKDYQQLRVITQLAKDLDLALRIVGVPTVREKDGLALSSRNAYLSPEERAAAPTLHRVLKDCATRIKKGAGIERTLVAGRNDIEAAGFRIDYLEARDAVTLEPVRSPEFGPVRLLVAATLGRTRLIDNMGV